MHTAIAPPPGALPVDAGKISLVRLHGKACWFCGTVQTPLRPIGEVATTTDGGYRIWPVVGCPDHVHQDIA